MKVIAFNGSPRSGGNTELMLKRILAAVEAEGIETELVKVGGERIRGCRACYVCRKMQNKKCVYNEDLLNGFAEKIFEADAVVLGSPSYFCQMTAEMKALIDRVGMVAGANGRLLSGKIGAAVVAERRAGASSVFSAITTAMLMCGMIVPGSTYLNMGLGREKGEVANDEESMKNMDDLGKNIAFLLKKLKA